ncbi:MAG: protein-methionine-sulfoxide reductase catalytic subunit MsrP [Alphaproteobacteria bacterium]|nr:protein-methionine-sulfoxide reductase catalytic subunit MsrP [Alphaproteobacteria bacterium]
MHVLRKRGWELPDGAATPENVFTERRRLVKALAAGPALVAASSLIAGCDGDAPKGSAKAAAPADDPSAGLYPVNRNLRYRVERAITPEKLATTYNNFYEFGSHKSIHRAAQALPIRPWTVRVDGMVEKPFEIGIDDLLKKMPLEERVYRFRCVEAWAMTVPWSGFPLKALVDLAKPLSAAKYLRMETFKNPDVARGQRQHWYPWPYVEGLTMAEATNELAFIATGLYGKPIPKQNGAPLRLVVPWKYGFKNIKSLVRLSFTDKRPKTFWEEIQPAEYGFWANVNPEVPHPRWSQAKERLLDGGAKVPTRLFNGYGEFVAGLYAGLDNEDLFK